MEKRLKHAESMDRISSLPDGVIVHILSFLPTKYAAGTSILSTRWRYLFSLTHNLDFDDTLLLNPPSPGYYYYHSPDDQQKKCFMNFVDRAIMHRNVSHIDRFRVKCRKQHDISLVNAWIGAALLRNVQELDISVRTIKRGLLPSCVFTCRTLVVLKLGEDFMLNVPTSVCLPSLKVLHLNRIEFSDDYSMERLFSSCPVLQDLDIIECDWKNIRVFSLSSLTLKRLTIDCLPENETDIAIVDTLTIDREYEIAIDAPNLEVLKYYDFIAKCYSLRNLHSPFKAEIILREGDKPRDTYNTRVKELIEGISKVQSLRLHPCSIETIQLYCHPIPVFYHLMNLDLAANINVSLELLPDLLKNSPHLETLVFQGLLSDDVQQYEDDDMNLFEWNPPVHVPSCLSTHLKEIKIYSFRGHEHELKMVRYFLKNAEVLKNMTVFVHEDYHNDHFEIAKKLLKLPRSSRTCEVEIF